MEFEPMLTPREKSPLPENVPRGGSNPRGCGQRAQALPTELFRPPATKIEEWVRVSAMAWLFRLSYVAFAEDCQWWFSPAFPVPSPLLSLNGFGKWKKGKYKHDFNPVKSNYWAVSLHPVAHDMLYIICTWVHLGHVRLPVGGSLWCTEIHLSMPWWWWREEQGG